MYPALAAHARSLISNPFPNPDYRVCHSKLQLSEYLYQAPVHPFSARVILAADTESLPTGGHFCGTISHTPGTGRLIYFPESGKSDPETLDYFRNYLNCTSDLPLAAPPHLLFHNYLHDGPIFDSLDFPIHKFTDTMVRAYNLCLGGGGDEEDAGSSRAGRGFLSLKILCWRNCHMRMTSFKDTVYPHSMPQLLEWLELAEAAFRPDPPIVRCECGCPRHIHIPRGKTGKLMGKCSQCACPGYKLRKKGQLEAKVGKPLDLLYRKVSKLAKETRELLTAQSEWEEGDEEEESKLDPWKRIRKWHDWDLETLVGCLGLEPLPSVAYVPEDKLLTYACGDADGTLRMYHHMRLLRPWLFY